MPFIPEILWCGQPGSEAQIGMWEQGTLGSSPEASSVAGPGWGMWNRALTGRAGRERGHSQLYFQRGETAWGVGGSVGRRISSFYVHPCDQICNITNLESQPRSGASCRDGKCVETDRPVETHIKICIHIIIRIIFPSVFFA